LSWSTKRIAVAAGFRNADVFGNYVARHAGVRLREFWRYGFGEWLKEVSAAVRHRRAVKAFVAR